jgi:aconitate hydratase
VLLLLGDSVTTDHISPAGSFGEATPAGSWLREQGVERADFNSYGARRGHHEVMMRGTFANVRIRNLMLPADADRAPPEGGYTLLDGQQTTVYAAAMTYVERGTPTIVIAGEEYGTGSSRDWAAKGTRLLGVRAVIARSLRTDPPRQSGRHGRAAAAVHGRRLGDFAGSCAATRASTSSAWARPVAHAERSRW